MKQKYLSKRIVISALSLAIVIFLTFIMYQAPLNSDDFVFSDLRFDDFSSAISYVLHYGNGRVLGNLSVVLLIKHKFMGALVKALIVWGIIYLTYRIISRTSNTANLLVAFLLFVGIPPMLFGDILTWTSGFMNYVPPILLFLLCYYWIFKAADSKKYQLVLLFCCSVASCLYVEHCTAIYLMISVIFVAYTFKKDKKRFKSALVFLGGSCIGAMFMCLVPVIFDPISDLVKNHRSIPIDSAEIIYRTKDFLLYMMTLYHSSAFLLSIASLSVLRLIKSSGERNSRIALGLRKIVYIIYPVISVSQFFFDKLDSYYIPKFIALSIGFALYCVCYIYDMNKYLVRGKKSVIFLWSLALLSVVPFCVIRPIGYRCFNLWYLCTALSVYYMYIYSKQEDKCSHLIDNLLVCVLTLSLGILLSMEFIKIGKHDRLRIMHIEHEMKKGAHSITVDEFKSRYAVKTWAIGSRYYYESPGDITFIIN